MLLARVTAVTALFCIFVHGNNLEVLDQFQQQIARLQNHGTPFMFKASIKHHLGEMIEVPTIYTPSSVVQRVHQFQDPFPSSQEVENRFAVKVLRFQSSHYVVNAAQYALLTSFQTHYQSRMDARQAALFDLTFKEWLDFVILRGYGGQIALLERPSSAVEAIQTSRRSGWYELDDAGNRHLSWWNAEYQKARETVCRQPRGARRVLNMLGDTFQSLRGSGYRRIPEDCYEAGNR